MPYTSATVAESRRGLFDRRLRPLPKRYRRDDFVSNKDTFAEVKMPNEENFFIDNRPDVKNERCFKNCADPSKFEIVTTINGVTPTGHFKEDSGVAANHYEGNPSAASESGNKYRKKHY